MIIYSEVSPTKFNGIYSYADMQSIAASSD